MTATGGAQAPTRVAVIGAGNGANSTRGSFRSPSSLLCAVVARRRERAEERAASGRPSYTSIGEMLASERPDLVTMSCQ